MTELVHLETHIDNRVLPPVPYATLAEYIAVGGGKGLEAARAASAETVIRVWKNAAKANRLPLGRVEHIGPR